MEDIYICCRCNKKLVLQKVSFFYLGRDFSGDVLKCPDCGQVFIPECIVKEKMIPVEQSLEGK